MLPSTAWRVELSSARERPSASSHPRTWNIFTTRRSSAFSGDPRSESGESYGASAGPSFDEARACRIATNRGAAANVGPGSVHGHRGPIDHRKQDGRTASP